MRHNPKRDIALTILAAGGDISEAAELANISRPTIYKWLIDPDFKRDLAKRQSDMVQRLTAKFLGLGDEAVAAIKAGLNDRAINTRLRAAAIYGNKYTAFIELGLLDARITALEDRVAQGKK